MAEQVTHLSPAPATGGQLTEQQLKTLLAGLQPWRVGKNPRGFSHLEAWDVRRFLIRVFGFTGFDTELLGIDLVRELELPAKDGKPRWTVVYRVHQRLTVKDVHGRPIGRYEGVATGSGQNQPSLADAHDLAVKEADSQALKRAAVNLGDAFGMSLYNGGAVAPVVVWSAAHPGPSSEPGGTDEAPVQPDPEESPTPESVGVAQLSDTTVDAGAAEALQQMWAVAREAGFADGLPDQFRQVFGHPVEDGTAAEFRQAYEQMRQSVTAA